MRYTNFSHQYNLVGKSDNNVDNFRANIGGILDKLGQLEDIEDELGFSLNELIQMLINGIYEAGAVNSETMLPVSEGITHFYIYGINFENKKIKIFHKETGLYELDLDKYKQKCLSGWALTKEELL